MREIELSNNLSCLNANTFLIPSSSNPIQVLSIHDSTLVLHRNSNSRPHSWFPGSATIRSWVRRLGSHTNHPLLETLLYLTVSFCILQYSAFHAIHSHLHKSAVGRGNCKKSNRYRMLPDLSPENIGSNHIPVFSLSAAVSVIVWLMGDDKRIEL